MDYCKTISSLVAVILLILWTLATASYGAEWQWLSPQRAYSLIKEGSGLWLVDVRNEAAFTDLHIEGAVHIPASLLAIKQLPKEKLIVLVDDSLGLQRGREAATILLKSGHDKVYLLEGGVIAWQQEKLPVTGKVRQQTFRRVVPEEITWAQANRIPLRIFDVRDKEELEKGAFPQALEVAGKNLAERLEKVKGLISKEEKQGMVVKLDKGVSTILIFPLANDPRTVLESSFRGVSGDIRYLEGGYAAWAARPEKNSKSVGACPTCPKR
jgi:rhodanese-related sulfurtransferase